MEKGEIAHIEQFHLFPQRFPQAFFFNVLKWVYMEERVNLFFMYYFSRTNLSAECNRYESVPMTNPLNEIWQWIQTSDELLHYHSLAQQEGHVSPGSLTSVPVQNEFDLIFWIN